MCSGGENVIYKVAWGMEDPVVRGIEHFQASLLGIGHFQASLLLECSMGKFIPKDCTSGCSGRVGG